MAEIIKIPVKRMRDGTIWLILKYHLGKKVVFRATDISKPKRVFDYVDHECSESIAEGSVKCRSKLLDISNIILEV